MAKCHAGELGHGARTKAGENLLITRLQPVEKRSTQWRNALSPPPPLSTLPPLQILSRDWRRNNGYTGRRGGGEGGGGGGSIRKENDIAVLRLECPPPVPLRRIDSSFNFKVNIYLIFRYILSRSFKKFKQKFQRSGKFTLNSTIQDIFSNLSRETRDSIVKEGKNSIFVDYICSYIIITVIQFISLETIPPKLLSKTFCKVLNTVLKLL